MRPRKESVLGPKDHSSATTPEYTHYAPRKPEAEITLRDGQPAADAPDTSDDSDPGWGPANRTAPKPG